jgi:hypothetical protein
VHPAAVAPRVRSPDLCCGCVLMGARVAARIWRCGCEHRTRPHSKWHWSASSCSAPPYSAASPPCQTAWTGPVTPTCWLPLMPWAPLTPTCRHPAGQAVAEVEHPQK